MIDFIKKGRLKTQILGFSDDFFCSIDAGLIQLTLEINRTRSVGFAHDMKCKDNHLIQMVKWQVSWAKPTLQLLQR